MATAPEINQELRIATDTTTWLAETLHGSMRTEFEFDLDGLELRGEDGGSLNEIFDDAITEAKEIVKENPSMLFELRRRLIERGELDDMYKMANGELPNTMIVLSDFPPELMNATEDVGGYNAGRKQTMMRIITAREGKIRVVSQSLDGSNREALESIYAGLGEEVREGELLEQRIHRDMPETRQDKLPDNLRQVYDDSLRRQRGGEWHAGISQRPDRNIVNTYEFARNQNDLIEWFTQEKLADSAGAEKYRYKVAATAKARHKRYLKEQNDPAVNTGPTSPHMFVKTRHIRAGKGLEHEMAYEGWQAAKRGDVFSGCGDTVTAEDEAATLAGNLSAVGYGNRSTSASASEQGVMKCVNCPSCSTYHEEVRAKGGYFRCKNDKCGYKAKA